MKNEKENIDDLNLLRKIHSNPKASQRELAKQLGFSLGKINYCLNALKSKGLIKLNNFRNNKNKFSYVYVITPKGFVEKTKLTVKYMKIKMDEYDQLQKELANKKYYENKIKNQDMK